MTSTHARSFICHQGNNAKFDTPFVYLRFWKASLTILFKIEKTMSLKTRELNEFPKHGN